MLKRKTSGYILLLSALIVSAVLLAAVLGTAAAGFFLNSGALDTAARQQSFFLAWSCLQTARLHIIQNPQAPQTGEVEVSGSLPTGQAGSCQIISITLDAPAAGQITIQSRAAFNGAVANLQMAVDTGDLSLISWEDLDSS